MTNITKYRESNNTVYPLNNWMEESMIDYGVYKMNLCMIAIIYSWEFYLQSPLPIVD